MAKIPKNILATGLTSFLTDTSTKMLYSVMPVFHLSIGASKTTISLIEGIAESTASLLKAFSGLWSDKLGKKKPFMIIGYGLTALITPRYALATVPVHVLIFRFIERIGKGLRAAPRDSLISASTTKGESGKNFGFQKAMDNSGAILGPLIAFLLLSMVNISFKNLFLLSAIPALLGVLSIVLLVKETPLKTVTPASPIYERPVGNNLFILLPKRFWYFLAVVFLFSLSNSTDALLLVKTAESGVKQEYVPFFYMIFSVVSVLFAIPAGKWSDKTGRTLLITAGYAIYAVTYFFFGFFNSPGMLIPLFVFYGLYSALTDGNQKALISDLVPPELKGTAFGIYHAVLGISLLPASLIAGTLYDKVNTSAPFYFGALMALAAVVMLFFGSVKFRSSATLRI